MRVVVAMARLSGASELLDITGAHIDACLFHGYAGLDFAGCWYAAERGCGSRRRSTCRHWTCCTGTATAGTRIPPPPAGLMDSYVAMGARATWTCAPYQLPTRPGLGEHRQSETCGQTADGRNR